MCLSAEDAAKHATESADRGPLWTDLSRTATDLVIEWRWSYRSLRRCLGLCSRHRRRRAHGDPATVRRSEQYLLLCPLTMTICQLTERSSSAVLDRV